MDTSPPVRDVPLSLVGQRIRHLGLSAALLAKVAGCSGAYAGQVCRGDRPPSGRLLKALARLEVLFEQYAAHAQDRDDAEHDD